MSTTHYCDRCGAELWHSSTARVQLYGQVSETNGVQIAELCEACTVELGHWLGEPKEKAE